MTKGVKAVHKNQKVDKCPIDGQEGPTRWQ